MKINPNFKYCQQKYKQNGDNFITADCLEVLCTVC